MGKDVQIIINPRFYFTETQKQLWNCCNIYESAVSITSSLKTITNPLKEIKMVKEDPIAQLFTKKISHFTIPLSAQIMFYSFSDS